MSHTPAVDHEALLGSFPSREQLAELAQARFIRPRVGRYMGDTLTLSIGTLPAEHAAIVRGLYSFLRALYDFAAGQRQRGAEALGALIELLSRHGFERLIEDCATLRAAMTASATRELVRQTYHDVRGGSLTSLVGHLEMVLAGEIPPDEAGSALTRVFLLARDHLKIMRNAIHDLDTAAYAEDLQHLQHSAELLREKWTSVAHHTERGRVRVVLDCDFSGCVSDRCMELSALDRVLYNLINNAAEHAGDGVVLVRAFPIDEHEATHLRFAVINRVTEEQQARLDELLHGQLERLFEGGITTGGHGIGMSICGEIVSHSYGLRSVLHACDRGYLGARIIDGCFVAWFHWPARRANVAA
jgi:signal transduction histidine kinase